MREHLETGAVKENEHNRPLQLEERRLRLTEERLIELKVLERKALLEEKAQNVHNFLQGQVHKTVV